MSMKQSTESEKMPTSESLLTPSSEKSILREVVVDAIPQIRDNKKELEEKLRLCQEEAEKEEHLMFSTTTKNSLSEKPQQKGLRRIFSQGRNIFRKLMG